MSHLDTIKPKAEELVDLDGFDLAFLVMTGHVCMETLDEMLVDVSKAPAEVVLWGPEAQLAASVLIRAWNKHGKGLTRDIEKSFDLRGDISVDRRELDAAFEKHKGVGQRVWDEANEKVGEILSATNDKARTYYQGQRRRGLAKKVDDDRKASFDRYMRQALQSYTSEFVKTYPDRVLHPEVKRLARITQYKPEARIIDSAQLSERIKRVSELPPKYLANASDVHVGRMWTFTGIQMAHEASVTTYQVSAVYDKRTCPVCKRMDGKYFEVKQAHERMMKYLKEYEPPEAPLSPFQKGVKEERKEMRAWIRANPKEVLQTPQNRFEAFLMNKYGKDEGYKVYRSIDYLMSEWGRSSNGEEAGMLKAAAQRSGAGGPIMFHQGFKDNDKKLLAALEKKIAGFTTSWEKRNPIKMDDVFRLQYSWTQEMLREAGVKKLDLYRGIQPQNLLNAGFAPQDLPTKNNPVSGKMMQNPVSSWTTDKKVSTSFSPFVMSTSTESKDIFFSFHADTTFDGEKEVMVLATEPQEYTIDYLV